MIFIGFEHLQEHVHFLFSFTAAETSLKTVTADDF